MRVLVTGSTGYLGRAIVSALATAGHSAVAYGRTATSSGLTATLIDGDIRDAPAVSRAANGCDAIIHAAALVAVWRRNRREFDDVNVGGLHNVIAAGADAGVSRIIYTSSFLARPPAGIARGIAWNDYQRTKAIAAGVADVAAANGAPLIRLVPGVIYGPGRLTDGNLVGRQVADHLAGRLPGLVGSSRIWSFAYVDDVAAAHVAALDRGRIGAVYDVGGENAPQMRVFEIIRELTGKRLPRRLPVWLAAGVAFAEEWLATWFRRTPQLTTGTLEILLHDWPLDSRVAQEELGYLVTPLRDGVARILSWLQSEHAARSGQSPS